MTLLIAFLTFVLVVNCLMLMLLVLIQLPKKEAGAGVAFGGAATDALFGAGSGNALTKMTKYSAGVFVVLSLSLSLLNSNVSQASNRRLEEELLKKANETGVVLPTPESNPVAEIQIPTPTDDSLATSAVTNLLNSLSSNAVSSAESESPAEAAEEVNPEATPESVAPEAATSTNAPAAPSAPPE